MIGVVFEIYDNGTFRFKFFGGNYWGIMDIDQVPVDQQCKLIPGWLFHFPSMRFFDASWQAPT